MSIRGLPLWYVETMVRYGSRIMRIARRINLNVLRFLSIALLLLSLTPLASLYVLLCSSLKGTANQNESTMMGDDSTGNINAHLATATSNLLTVIQNPNSTLEEILTAMFLERTNAIGGPFPANMAYHWAAVLPWLLSMFFGFVVPLSLYAVSIYQGWRLELDRERPSQHRVRRRRERILPSIYKYRRNLRKQDFVCEDVTGIPIWKIPHPGVSCLAEKTICKADERSVSGNCAICLNNYDEGDEITWSRNPRCIHHYHLECIVGWYTSRRRKHYLCPCCRQIFTSRHC